MFAVIKTGGKQYKVAKDDKLVVEKLSGEPGTVIELSDVLMIGEDGKAPTVGAPRVEKAAVFAEVIEQGKADKVLIFKKKRRQNYRRTKGHRQEQTFLKIVEISPTGTKPKTAAKKAAPKKETAKEDAPKKATPKKAAPKKTAKADAAPAKEAKAEAKKPAAKKPAAKKKAPAKKKTEE
jgi:large subunit ribosomal protein L21